MGVPAMLLLFGALELASLRMLNTIAIVVIAQRFNKKHAMPSISFVLFAYRPVTRKALRTADSCERMAKRAAQ